MATMVAVDSIPGQQYVAGTRVEWRPMEDFWPERRWREILTTRYPGELVVACRKPFTQMEEGNYAEDEVTGIVLMHEGAIIKSDSSNKGLPSVFHDSWVQPCAE